MFYMVYQLDMYYLLQVNKVNLKNSNMLSLKRIMLHCHTDFLMFYKYLLTYHF